MRCFASMKVEYPREVFEILHLARILHVCIQSLISECTHRILFYMLGSNRRLYLPCCLKCSIFDRREHLHLTPVSFWFTRITLCVSLYSALPSIPTLQCASGWSCECSALRLESAIPPMNTGSFYWKMALGTEEWGPGVLVGTGLLLILV